MQTDEKVIYPGRDLEAMSFAVNYHRWILQIFQPHLGRRVVEVGAGSGSFSELLLERARESLSLVEPSEDMFGLLREKMAQPRAAVEIMLYNAVFCAIAPEIKARQQPDSIIYVNVLEHIADDQAELAAISATLETGGKLFIFVPALRWLYSRFDESIGHFRRYAKSELEEKCRQAGFNIITSSYFDMLGIAPWLVKYRWLKSLKMEPQAVLAYDKYIVPGTRALETALVPPLGKNIILIAEKVAAV